MRISPWRASRTVLALAAFLCAAPAFATPWPVSDIPPDPAVKLWDGDSLKLASGLTLIRCGGHYAGGTVLHWAAGAGGRGALLAGDIVQVIPDRGWVSFMYSYPNLIPLPAAEVERIAAALEPYAFDAIQGAWWETTIPHDAKAIVRRSAERYVRALKGEPL